MKSAKSHPPRSKEEIESITLDWESSGLKKKEFTEKRGINYMTFIGWFSERRNRLAKAAPGTAFIPVKVSGVKNDAPFAEITLKNARSITLHQPVSIEYLIAVLKC